MRPPCGLAEIKAMYGDPFPFMREDGTVSPLWEARMVRVALPVPVRLGWVETAVRSVRVNQAIASEVDRVFKALISGHLWDYIETYDGGYCWRPQRGTGKRLSMHGFGAALDFNAADNRLGTKGSMHPGIVAAFEGHGWTWGGSWTRSDPMHFQYGRGY